ncbi:MULTISPECIES: hypothetical protein [unclassified Kitasatospora]|uniref:hypothetical protein n=1 Tax=unclassified Kitasatospora TaxID=2633591 RepID=UPI000A5E5400|nr:MULTISPECIES: hypothetical protein [unclassified Kitasatospora]
MLAGPVSEAVGARPALFGSSVICLLTFLVLLSVPAVRTLRRKETLGTLPTSK